MITIIFGAPGAGKTAFLTYLLRKVYKEQRESMLRFTCKKILEINNRYGKQLTLPTQAPIFVNKN